MRFVIQKHLNKKCAKSCLANKADMKNNVDLKHYLSEKNLLRLALVLVVIFAVLAGYYQAAYDNEAKKYLRLEDRYVRVRQQLGRDETQRLLDESYGLE